MGMIAVLVAAAAAWGFGALWYGALSQRWLDAAELEEGDYDPSNPLPYIASFIAVVLVSGMTRHIFASSGVDGFGAGLLSGLGLGLFIATPWIATNYLYAHRKGALVLIDGAYATIGCGVIGAVLGLF